jgi:formate transporter
MRRPEAFKPIPGGNMAVHEFQIDALLPADMAVKVEYVGERKASLDPFSTLTLAVLAGTFIAFGAVFSTVVAAGAGDALPFGLTRLLSGLVFSLGLILVLVGGAELFTGNNLIVMACASRRVSTRLLLNNWALVYLGNFVGAMGTALLVYLSGQYGFGKGLVGAAALSIANGKTGLDFAPAVALGILCNALVCLAVWLTFSARTTTDRILAIIPPVAAFVAAGFEHSIANMYFVPIGLLIKAGAPASFWATIGKTAADFPTLTWTNFFLRNLVPVTLGNIIGGALVGAVYWSVYLRPQRLRQAAPQETLEKPEPVVAIASEGSR